jgi:hypothetical protein
MLESWDKFLILERKNMRYLIVQDKQGTPCMSLLPARTSREEAQTEVDRMNEIVKRNNKDYEQFQQKIKSGAKLAHGEVFLHSRDDRIFDIKEVED